MVYVLTCQVHTHTHVKTRGIVHSNVRPLHHEGDKGSGCKGRRKKLQRQNKREKNTFVHQGRADRLRAETACDRKFEGRKICSRHVQTTISYLYVVIPVVFFFFFLVSYKIFLKFFNPDRNRGEYGECRSVAKTDHADNLK